ncbi:hypothetical protein [Leptothoe spongobia]|uniref:Uncharacterized protein n=1 Tax=Leptothoe spongobia TAU-MAC 1115 TaxID=1967444 RepID=A0A947DG58_9CYAN|nr:hypothetical protein [Leptothoe spongobia]MBT9315963.1 hypothetical protein [Leptothoe spongobia TAU-MAC 1115]
MMLATLALPNVIGLIIGIVIAMLVSLVGIVLLTAAPAQAALPPQANTELRDNSLFVVTGAIQQVSTEEVPIDIGSNHQYHAVVTVETVEKAAISPNTAPLISFPLPDVLPAPASQIDVYYWQSGQRPTGWAGPSGQYRSLKSKTTVRLFLTVEQGQLTLLEPNGWEPVE